MNEVVALVCGAVLALVTWLSVLRTVYIPRSRSSLLMRTAVRAVRWVGATVARRLPAAAADRVMDLCAPLALYAAVTSWLAATLAGFALMAPLLAGVPLTWAGLTSFLMLRTGGLLAVAAWLSVALVLSSFVVHLFRVTSAYSRRERAVARMTIRAANVTEAEQVLAEYLRLGSRERLDQVFAQWAEWLADIRATHTGYPALTIYRSATELCWLDAAVLLLDAAALTEAVAPRWAPPGTRSLLEAGKDCFPVLARQVGVRMPRPMVSLEGREERDFEHTLKVAIDAGLPEEFDHYDAWPAFQDWRTCYAPYAVAVGQRTCHRRSAQAE